MINGRTRLHVVANGIMTGQRYIDEILLPHVRLFRGAVGDKFVFMDDNATCHRTLAVQDCLDSEGIQRLVWPARSPDLNSIENVWDALGRQVAVRNYPPTNKNTLIRALTEEWDKLPQQLLDNVVQSMVERSPRKGLADDSLPRCCLLYHPLAHQRAAMMDFMSLKNNKNVIIEMMPSSFYQKTWGLSRAGRITEGTAKYVTKPKE
ncbi:death-associated protein kinase dapk-1 [Trichonephila clavipes]|uniref:Death-associated protein kinase dapk-1 n=1 Tax=Trichonephila clavipes TaxID=2585209 RepID=A0A8X6RFY7_TRICX|nr:death-associated protein kinase dapk-1 [Trichonephila clavipes]